LSPLWLQLATEGKKPEGLSQLQAIPQAPKGEKEMSLKGIVAKINKARDDYIEGQEKKAQRNLERLKTKTAREEERAKLQHRRDRAKEEAEKARTKAIKAETARKKAQKELKGEGIISSFRRSLVGKPKRKRSTRRAKSRRVQ